MSNGLSLPKIIEPARFMLKLCRSSGILNAFLDNFLRVTRIIYKADLKSRELAIRIYKIILNGGKNGTTSGSQVN